MKLIQCPLCGNNDQEPRLVKNGYQIVSCRGCHLFFVNPQPEEGELFCFYQQHQQLYLQQYPRKEIAKRREARRELRRIERLLGRGWISVFDIGCGCGFFLQEAVARGMNARGVDLAQSEVQYARDHFGVAAESANFLDSSYNPGETFDVITMFDVIEHWPDPVAGLVKCHSLLKDSGYLIVGTPDVSSAGKYLVEWEDWKPPEHLFYFSHETLIKMAEKAGFRYRGDFWRVPWRKRIKAVFQADFSEHER